MRIGFIGAGKVGHSLGRYFCEHQLDVMGYYSRTRQSALEAANFTGTMLFEDIESIVEASDTLFLTVPDGAIKEVWDYIVKLSIKNKIICHCSGSLSSEIFEGIEAKGAFGYSVHPLYALSDKLNSYKDLQKAFFTVEGSEGRMDDIVSLIKDLGNEVQIISPENKIKYHCAAVFVSNFVVALAQTGIDLLKECGFDEANAGIALGPLMAGNMENIVRQGPVKALTGPVERSDSATVEQHLGALSQKDLELYKLLSQKLLSIAKRKNPGYDYRKLDMIIEEKK
jgi:predicted short-subunit dehydrogenase-like oxidoreductase (DUF2520 family)